MYCTYTKQFAKCKQIILLCSPVCTVTGDAASHPPPPLLHFLPPFLPPSAAHSACVLSYLLQPIIVPTYGVSSCKPQFRGSEILLSDCHNASASGEGRTPACSPSLPSSLSSSLRLPPRSLSLTLSVFLAEMLHLCFQCVSSRRPVSLFLL